MSCNVTREMPCKPPISLSERLEVANLVCARNGGDIGDLQSKERGGWSFGGGQFGELVPGKQWVKWK